MTSKQVTLLKLHELPSDALIEVNYRGKTKTLPVREVMGLIVGKGPGTFKRTPAQKALIRAGVHLRWLRKAIEEGDTAAIQRHQLMCDKLASPEWTQEMLAKARPVESDMTAEEAAELEAALSEEGEQKRRA